jgi:hypothetical protein
MDRLPRASMSILSPQQLNFCSCNGTAHFDLGRRGVFLALRHRAGVEFYKQSIFEPGKPPCARGFFNSG